MPNLETPCPACHGNGRFQGSPNPFEHQCPDCGGRGQVPTEAGKRLLAFLKHHLSTGEHWGGEAWRGELVSGFRGGGERR